MWKEKWKTDVDVEVEEQEEVDEVYIGYLGTRSEE
jgi:hypothetical protein